MYPGFGFQERKSHALLSFPSIGVEPEVSSSSQNFMGPVSMVRNAMEIHQKLRLLNHGCWISGL
jgi:hypothetical protein